MQALEAHDRMLQQPLSSYAAQKVHHQALQDTPIQNLPRRLRLPSHVLEPNHQPTNSLGITEAEQSGALPDPLTLS